MTTLLQLPPFLVTAASQWSNMATSSLHTALLDQSISYHYLLSTTRPSTSLLGNPTSPFGTPTTTTTTATSLNGYAFSCGGLFVGFSNDKDSGTSASASVPTLHCRSATANGGQTFACGTYDYNETEEHLQGETSITGSFQTSSLQWLDHVLVGFRMIHAAVPEKEDATSTRTGEEDAEPTTDTTIVCHAVSLDWTNYSHQEYLGLQCPLQQHHHHHQQHPPTPKRAVTVVDHVSLWNEHHFSFGRSGDVALRSPLLFQPNNDRAQKVTLDLRDVYGVYRIWEHANKLHTETDTITDTDTDDRTVNISIYFGPQQGRPATILEGTLLQNKNYNKETEGHQRTTSQSSSSPSSLVEMYVGGYEPAGPCQHDGTSSLVTLKGFPRHGPVIRNKKKSSTSWNTLRLILGRSMARIQNIVSLIHKATSTMVYKHKSSFPAFAMTTVMVFVTEVWQTRKWLKILLNNSCGPRLIQLVIPTNKHQKAVI